MWSAWAFALWPLSRSLLLQQAVARRCRLTDAVRDIADERPNTSAHDLCDAPTLALPHAQDRQLPRGSGAERGKRTLIESMSDGGLGHARGAIVSPTPPRTGCWPRTGRRRPWASCFTKPARDVLHRPLAGEFEQRTLDLGDRVLSRPPARRSTAAPCSARIDRLRRLEMSPRLRRQCVA
jgi:hypothetical protein